MNLDQLLFWLWIGRLIALIFAGYFFFIKNDEKKGKIAFGIWLLLLCLKITLRLIN